uniref:Putative thioredoxin/protein disulfide isomerase n=1 Tax=Anopheles triannulatus TaxID=58253 RepID=A0A2M4A3I6_9DIPT
MPTLTQGPPSAEDCGSNSSSCIITNSPAQTAARRSRTQPAGSELSTGSNQQQQQLPVPLPVTRRHQLGPSATSSLLSRRKRLAGTVGDDSAEGRVVSEGGVIAPTADKTLREDDVHVAPTISAPASSSSSNSSASVPNSAELSVVDGRTRRYSRISMIIIYGREALCILALLLTTYATIQNTPPKIAKAPPPVPFFSKGSFVSDFPTGSLGTTQTRVSVSELSFVFYYAPWCAESQFAREAYEAVARLYYRQAHFAAINCWQPEGACKQRYPKVQSWPVLMAYLQNGLALQYHQAWTPASLSRFVQSLMTPLQRFVNPADLMERMTGKDAVIVAYVDMATESSFYQRYYQAALKWVEKDSFQGVPFGVVTGQSASLFGVETVPSIRLYLWNETIEYIGKESWAPQDMVSWIHKQLQVVSMWIAPPGSTKSATIAPGLEQGPVLFLFTPRSLYTEFDDSTDAYMMLRQLSMQYYNCGEDNWVKEMAQEYIADQRVLGSERYFYKQQECERILGRHPAQEDDTDPTRTGRGRREAFKSTVSVSFVNVLNSSKFVDGRKHGGKGDRSDGYCEAVPAPRGDDGSCSDSCGTFGPERKPSLRWTGRPEEQEECFAKMPSTQSEPVQSSRIDATNDYRGPLLLTKQYLRHQCELMRLAENDGTYRFFPEAGERNATNAALDTISGLACKHNKTLTFFSMDSTLYHAFAERLGIDVLQEPNRTVAFIVDTEAESTYALRAPINLVSLTGFLHGYYNRSWPRFLRSSSTRYAHTHRFNLTEFRQQDERLLAEHRARLLKQKAEAKGKAKPENANGGNARPEATKPLNAAAGAFAPREYHSIREIYSVNFQRVVLESNRTVVVNFYSSHCAFCSIMSNYLLRISRLLRHQPLLEFVRIDGDRNDLGWEYSMELFPSLIIFPNGRKEESRIFPHNEQITMANLLGFIRSNLSPTERLHSTFLLCSTANEVSRTDCLRILQTELNDGIREGLRDWRRQPCARERILRRLQLLKHSYLDTLRCLSHSCDLNRLTSSRKAILQLWPNEAPYDRRNACGAA